MQYGKVSTVNQVPQKEFFASAVSYVNSNCTNRMAKRHHSVASFQDVSINDVMNFLLPINFLSLS